MSLVLWRPCRLRIRPFGGLAAFRFSPMKTFQIPQRPEWGQPNYKDIVRNRHRFIESLPLPIVHYPDAGGTWIFFQESDASQPLLCSCQRDAAIGFLLLNAQHPVYRLGRDQSLVDFFMPPSLRAVSPLRASSIEDFGALPLFRPGLCHVCNRRVPSIRWSNVDNCSIFIQHLGWYLHHALLRAGVSPFGDVLQGGADQEIVGLVEIDAAEGYRRIREYLAGKRLSRGTFNGAPSDLASAYAGRMEVRAICQTLHRQRHRIHRLIEERLRRSLGFPPHGKTGGSEILLRWIVSALFPGREMLVRNRAEFLQGLELDIYLPELRLGIEYQGEQHYLPFKHLGGESHLRGVVRRDKRKAALCKQAGVDLIYFNVADKLTEDFVSERLSVYTKQTAGRKS